MWFYTYNKFQLKLSAGLIIVLAMAGGFVGDALAYDYVESYELTTEESIIELDSELVSNWSKFSIRLDSETANSNARVLVSISEGELELSSVEFALASSESVNVSPEVDHEEFEDRVGDHFGAGLITPEIELPNNATSVVIEVVDLNNAAGITVFGLDKLPENAGGDIGTQGSNSFSIDGVQIVSRTGWGCKSHSQGGDPNSNYYCDDPYWKPTFRPITHLVVHHTATDTNSFSDQREHVRAIWRNHAISRNWGDIGYNYLIAPDGTIYEGRNGGEGVTAGHASGHNRGTVGIGLLGNYSSQRPSNAMLQSLERLSTVLATRYNLELNERGRDYGGRTNLRLSGHRDWGQTACPGNSQYQLLDSTIARLRVEITSRKALRTSNAGCPPGFLASGSECARAGRSDNWTTLPSNVAELQSWRNGEVLARTVERPEIYSLDTDGEIATFALLPSAAQSLDIDTSTELVYAASTDEIYVYNYSGGLVRSFPLEYSISRIAATGDRVFVLSTDNRLYTLHSETGAEIHNRQLNINHVEIPYFIAHSGKLVVGPDTHGRAMIIDGAGSLSRPQGARTPSRSAAKVGSHIYLLSGAGRVERINLSNNSVSQHSVTSTTGTEYLVGAGDLLLVQNFFSSELSRITRNRQENFNLHPISDGARLVSGVYLFARPGQQGVTRLDLNNTKIPRTQSVHRFWSRDKQGHFYTASNWEKNDIIQNYPRSTWAYELEASYVLPNGNTSGARAVYRFWSDRYQRHFYTISRSERDSVIANSPRSTWRYEGIAYYAYTNSRPHTKPVYRFWSDSMRGHFYTNSTWERDNIIQNSPSHIWRYEGIAFYTY